MGSATTPCYPFAVEAASVGDALAASLPEGSKLARLPWLLLESGDHGAVHLEPFALRVETQAKEAQVRARCKAAAAHVAAAKPARDMPELPKETSAAWQSALRAAKIGASEDPGRTTLRLAGKELDPFLLWPLLRCPRSAGKWIAQVPFGANYDSSTHSRAG